METIKTYIENTFSAFPQTDEIKTAKLEIITRLENRYDELKIQGKSENEIVGIIISEFNNISDIINEQLKRHQK